MTDLTYVALKPIKVGGKMRQPGDLVPEATTWHNLPAYLSTGRISAIPKSSAVIEEEVVEEITEEKTGYASLTAEEVKAHVEDGDMTIDEAYEQELELDKPRKGVIAWLEKKAEDSITELQGTPPAQEPTEGE